jgi:hypothetical protein
LLNITEKSKIDEKQYSRVTSVAHATVEVTVAYKQSALPRICVSKEEFQVNNILSLHNEIFIRPSTAARQPKTNITVDQAMYIM